MKSRKVYIFNVEITKTGFSTYSNEYPIITTGETLVEIRKNVLEALKLFLEKPYKKVFLRDIQLTMSIRSFFKGCRILNANRFSNRINMNSTLLSQYVNGPKHPSEEQMKKINVGIKEIADELSTISLVLHH